MQLKDLYSKVFLNQLSDQVQKYDNNFDKTKFISACMASDWDDLKLMERSDRIVESLHRQLPNEFKQASEILRKIGPQFHGLAATCLPNYVAHYGLDDWEISMRTLELLTQYSSAEFAIRPFLVKYPTQTNQQMLEWSKSTNVDVRRLASEGIRPRLPWGIRLKEYVKDPTVIFPILKNLIFDDSEYVQKSVANNLNDISKDNPQMVLDFVQRYRNQRKQTDWVISRGLRTLFKQGNPEVLDILGYDPKASQWLKQIQFTTSNQQVIIGQTSTMHYNVTADFKREQALYLGYRVHYVRINKTDFYKDFFVKKTNLKANSFVKGDFKINWKQLTTRKLYPGIHQIDLLVNTVAVASCQIDVLENLE